MFKVGDSVYFLHEGHKINSTILKMCNLRCCVPQTRSSNVTVSSNIGVQDKYIYDLTHNDIKNIITERMLNESAPNNKTNK